MYAVAFDLVVADTEQHHPRDVSQAYAGAILNEFDFLRVQENEGMAKFVLAIQALRSMDWFPKSVRNIRAFRVEQWSDFTPLVKSN